MLKIALVSPLVLFALAACGSDDGSSTSEDAPVGRDGSGENANADEGDATTNDDANDDAPQTAVANERPEPFVTEFEGIVEQPAPWGGLEIAITGARLFRGEKPADFEALFFTSGTYAAVDVKVTQLSTNETDYSQRDTWDLILADGTRQRPLDNLGLIIAPGDSPTGHLYYSATDGLEFAGAAVEINGADRTTLEPLRIPLDRPATFESVAEVEMLVGQGVMATGEGELSFEILEATYGVNLPEISDRAPFDKRLLRLVTRVSYSGSFSESFSSVNDGPKVVVNGTTIAAEEGEIDTIPSGGSVDFPTLFHIDEGITELELLFDTQDGNVTRLPVTLPALL